MKPLLEIDKKHKNYVRDVRKALSDIDKKREKLIEHAAREVGITPTDDNNDAYEVFWDHVSNGTNWTIKYTK